MIRLCTVVDNHPRFLCEFVLWALCARQHHDGPIAAYFVNCNPSPLIEFAEGLGIECRFADPLIRRSPHCNKLIPFLPPGEAGDTIVTDCDVFLARSLTPLFQQDCIRLAPNNHAVPPLPVFQRVFAEAGLGDPEPGTALFAGGGNRETFAGNVSAGVICIPGSLAGFAEHWLQRARWLTDHEDLLGRFRGHIDQISFALAASEHGTSFRHLPAQANAVLQLLPEIQTVYAFHLTSGHIPHYPTWFAPGGQLIAEKINPALSASIDTLNQLTQQATAQINEWAFLRDFLPNFLNPAYRR